MTPLERITQLVNINGDVNNPDTPRPLLSLEDFFIDNNIHGSICCNVIPEQSPQAIYHHFLKIRERNNVSDVLVEITMFDDWICPYISRHLLSLNPLQARCRRYSRGER